MKNPFRLHLPRKTRASTTPLILFHDSGGTIAQYQGLQDLDRPTWGIHDPLFYSGRRRKGGIPEMAAVYVEMIKNMNAGPDVILGGWSFGGLIALEVAHQLTSLKALNVVGIIMLDSSCPLAIRQNTGKVTHVVPSLAAGIKPELRMLVARSMKAASIMIDDWDLPRWRQSSEDSATSTPTDKEDYAHSNSNGSSLIQANQLYGDQDGAMALDTLLDKLSQGPLPRAPPVILIRCEDSVPNNDDGATPKVDIARSDPSLGWDTYSYGLITSILTVPGNHFDIFSNDMVSSLNPLLAIIH